MRENQYPTEYIGFFPLIPKFKFFTVISAILILVSFVELPMCGASTIFGNFTSG